MVVARKHSVANILRVVKESDSGNYRFYICFEEGRLFVELFFTEDVNINGIDLSYVEPTGNGRSLGGKHKH